MKKLVIIIILFSSAIFAQYSQSNNTLLLNAVKDTSVAADEMVIGITVNKIDTSTITVNEASHSNLINVLELLKKYGYNNDDIYIISSNLRNDYSRQNKFLSSQSYRIILNKFELYDQLKKDLIAAGATDVSIVTFWSSKYEKIKQSLYGRAISEANSKAEYFISKFGAKDYKIAGLIDNSGHESINQALQFSRNIGGVDAVAVTIAAPGSNVTAPTITNGMLNISVSLRITYKYEY